MNNRLINTKVAGGGGGCTDIVDNYDPFGGGVALYQLNGNANDVSGNYDATFTSPSYTTGVFGQAASFSGTNYIEIPTLPDYRSGFAFSSWVLSDTTQNKFIITQKGTGGFTNFAYRLSSGKIALLTGNGTSAYYINYTQPTALTDGWHHIVVTGTASSITIYVDGAFLTTQTGTAFLNSSNMQHIMGVNYYNGSIDTGGAGAYSSDQFRFFSRALDPLEVEALYTEELCICDGTVDTLDILGDGSCIATYQLDGNANDLSGNYSGTPTDVSYGVGEFDLAGAFNGSSSYIETLITNSAIPTNSDFTISAWVNTRDVSTTNEIVVQGNNCCWDSVSFAFDIRTNGSLVIAFSNNSGGTGVLASSSTGVIQENIWYHVVGIVDIGNQISLYVNGSNVNNTSINSSSRISVATPFRIGADSVSVANFNGSIDQVRIFNKALNSTEVTTLYNETACTKAACSGTTNTLDILGDGSCIAAYPLDGSPADLSGNYNGVQTDVTYPVGKFDLAGAFNGTSSYVKNDNLPNEIFKGPFTINLWANTSVPQNTKNILHIQDDNNSNFPIVNIYALSSGYYINVRTNSTASFAEIANVPLTYNSWEMITVVLLSNGAKFYKNAVEIASFSFTSVFTTNTSSEFSLGRINQRWAGIVGNYYQGSIDQVRVFNRGLSAGEVTTLYNETPCN